MPQPKFRLNQVVLIRGGELDGIVGTIVALPSAGAAHLQIKNRDGVGFGNGDAVTTIRTAYLEPMPASRDAWQPGDLVSVLLHVGPHERWKEAVVLETAIIDRVDQALVDFGQGIGGWVPYDDLRERLVIPAFETPEEADGWAEHVREDRHRGAVKGKRKR